MDQEPRSSFHTFLCPPEFGKARFLFLVRPKLSVFTPFSFSLSLRFRVAFHRFLIALSVLQPASTASRSAHKNIRPKQAARERRTSPAEAEPAQPNCCQAACVPPSESGPHPRSRAPSTLRDSGGYAICMPEKPVSDQRQRAPGNGGQLQQAYLSRHCFEIRPGILEAMYDHFFGPKRVTRSTSVRSSYAAAAASSRLHVRSAERARVVSAPHLRCPRPLDAWVLRVLPRPLDAWLVWGWQCNCWRRSEHRRGWEHR